jgi:hypothetical protein
MLNVEGENTSAVRYSLFDIRYSALSAVRQAATPYLVEKKLPRPLNGLNDHRAGVIFEQLASW